MARRFRIPPPLFNPKSFDEERLVNMAQLSSEDIERVLEEAGLYRAYHRLCRKWLPFVRQKLEGMDTGVGNSVDEPEKLSEDRIEDGERLCRMLAMLYLGRRVGSLFVKSRCNDGPNPGDEDATLRLTSMALNELSQLIGERQAAEVFRRLQKATELVLFKELDQGR